MGETYLIQPVNGEERLVTISHPDYDVEEDMEERHDIKRPSARRYDEEWDELQDLERRER